MILVAYRHGLRVSELTDLHWDQIDFNAASLHVRRAKRVRRRRIPSSATSCGRCAGCNGSRIPSRRSCSPASAARPSPQRALPDCWSAPGRLPGLASRFIRTCCGTPVASGCARCFNERHHWNTGASTKKYRRACRLAAHKSPAQPQAGPAAQGNTAGPQNGGASKGAPAATDSKGAVDSKGNGSQHARQVVNAASCSVGVLRKP